MTESIYPKYDVIVVGGGHAGSEAAAAAAKMGAKTLLITMNLNAIAQMSCNPAIGGVAKGQIVREIDALGGIMGLITDKASLQFRMLNLSKGPAMWSPRAQCDRMLYAQLVREELEKIENLYFRQDNVTQILVDKEAKVVMGVKTQIGQTFLTDNVILTSGTFLNGLIHIGDHNYGGGRSGERASIGITESLNEYGFEHGRLKTGTPPRIDGRSLDYTKLEEQKGDERPVPFSFMSDEIPTRKRQLSCWIAYTTKIVHDSLREGFDRSPMFNGRIKSTGPRYCPSIEDKINRFADKDRHQLFIEPEGWNTYEIYLNGFSTSLPEDVQYQSLRKIEGFQKVVVLRPGYAIEYDYFQPHQIQRSLETKLISGLFFAGQINGTTGYEEAASQGLMAGINAARRVQKKEPLILKRSEAYIGVLIDDLVNKGTDEPYRMFTSRAEHRILLRQDNADLRLTELSYQIGLASKERFERYIKKKEELNQLYNLVESHSTQPKVYNNYLNILGTNELKQSNKLPKLLSRPEINLSRLIDIDSELSMKVNEITNNPDVIEQVEIQIKYSGYIKKEFEMADEMNKQESLKIPVSIDYSKIKSLSTEGKLKLDKIRPETIGQAGRISGVSSSDIAILMIYIKH